MLLYHFTSAKNLPEIMKTGLDRGEIFPHVEGNAVNLTADPSPEGVPVMGDADEHPVPADTSPPAQGGKALGAWLWRTRNVRITVKLPPADKKLIKWKPFVRKHVPWVDFTQALYTSTGATFGHWWLYFGIIPPAKFVAVETRVDGEWMPVEVMGSDTDGYAVNTVRKVRRK